MKSYLDREDIDSIRGKSFLELMGHDKVDYELALLYLAASLGLIPPSAQSWKDVAYGNVGPVLGRVLDGLIAAGLVVPVSDVSCTVRARDPAATLVVRVGEGAKAKEEDVLYDKYDGMLVEADDCHTSDKGFCYMVESETGKRVTLDVEPLWE